MWCEYMKLLDKEKIEDSVMWSKKKELGKELEEMCNLSQYIKEEGILQGRKEGKEEEKLDIAKKMKAEVFDNALIEKLTGILLH